MALWLQLPMAVPRQDTAAAGAQAAAGHAANIPTTTTTGSSSSSSNQQTDWFAYWLQLYAMCEFSTLLGER
jgi:hypothetical protein